jgi:hypothetical protein
MLRCMECATEGGRRTAILTLGVALAATTFDENCPFSGPSFGRSATVCCAASASREKGEYTRRGGSGVLN